MSANDTTDMGTLSEINKGTSAESGALISALQYVGNPCDLSDSGTMGAISDVENPYLTCPVCESKLEPLPPYTDLCIPIEDHGIIRTLRTHCKDHPREPLWNVQPRLDLAPPKKRKRGDPADKREKSTIVTVKGIVGYALRRAAIRHPLPKDYAFAEDWERVLDWMCIRIGAACSTVKFRLQPYLFKRESVHVHDKAIRAKLKKLPLGKQFACLKVEAIQYLHDLLEKVTTAYYPKTEELHHLHPVKPWHEWLNFRKRNFIELFFWNGAEHRDLGLICRDDLPVSVHYL